FLHIARMFWIISHFACKYSHYFRERQIFRGRTLSKFYASTENKRFQIVNIGKYLSAKRNKSFLERLKKIPRIADGSKNRPLIH
ncbi:MAG: hypothetical protein K6A96_08145, partial [Prevotella sp.]|nr:hypothetical protein [Prevotella sp.]